MKLFGPRSAGKKERSKGGGCAEELVRAAECPKGTRCHSFDLGFSIVAIIGAPRVPGRLQISYLASPPEASGSAAIKYLHPGSLAQFDSQIAHSLHLLNR